jgi:hypothetical protein
MLLPFGHLSDAPYSARGTGAKFPNLVIASREAAWQSIQRQTPSSSLNGLLVGFRLLAMTG